MSRFRDLTGERFGRLLVVKNISKTPTKWECLCNCGNTTVVLLGNLQKGYTKSCGCLSKELASERKKHGMIDSPEYKSWTCIKQRCFYDGSPNYKNYGGRGISMSPEYAEDFRVFLQEVGEQPKDGKKYSIDRLDNNIGYVKGNMRWVEDKFQSRNRRITSANTSGTNAVYWNWDRKTNKKLQAVATWYEESAKKTKTFSAKKYGILEAFAMACAYREQKIIELNELGFGYSDKHGK